MIVSNSPDVACPLVPHKVDQEWNGKCVTCFPCLLLGCLAGMSTHSSPPEFMLVSLQPQMHGPTGGSHLWVVAQLSHSSTGLVWFHVLPEQVQEGLSSVLQCPLMPFQHQPLSQPLPQPQQAPFPSKLSQNPGMVWVGKDLKDQLIPTLQPR